MLLPLFIGGAVLLYVVGSRVQSAVVSVAGTRPSSRILGALLKDGVDDSRLKPEAVRAAELALKVYARRGYPFILTSTYDGKHLATSRHYTDDAWDARTFHVPEAERASLAAEVRGAVGPGYDVLNEGTGPSYDRQSSAAHLHVEWDPKKR